MHARQAGRYRAGRVFVVGDAAHLFPATGVGLNAGLSDAVNLAWKLAADLKGHAPSGLLDTYDQERRLAGNRTMLHTLAQVALKRGHDTAANALREIFLELFSDEPALRRIAAMIVGADISYGSDRQDAHPLTGSFAPDLPLMMDGSRSSVAELLRSADPLLLDLADRAELRSVAQEWAPRAKK